MSRPLQRRRLPPEPPNEQQLSPRERAAELIKQRKGALILNFITTTTAALISISAFAFSPSDCGVSDKIGTPALQRYCASLKQKAIASDPSHGLIGKLEKADPIDGEPASQHYYWINGIYFDGNSAIGQRILKVCKVGQLCAVKVGEEKSYAHKLDHATFWISKLIGEPISE